MSLYKIDKQGIALTLNSLFDDTIESKPLRHMPAKEEKGEYNFLLVDMHQWIISNLDYKGRLINLDRGYLQRYIDKHSNKIFFANLSGSPEAVDRRLDKLDMGFFKDTIDMYIYFMKYMEECQFKFFEIYKTNRRTTAVPLMPWSFILNRFSNELYEIVEKKPMVDKHLDAETEKGMNNTYTMYSMRLDDGCVRTTKDLGIKLYHVDSSARDTSPMSKRWLEEAEKIDPSLQSHNQRVDMIKKLYTQYMYVGKQTITYTDGEQEGVFLLNFPIQTALNLDIGRVPNKQKTAEFLIK